MGRSKHRKIEATTKKKEFPVIPVLAGLFLVCAFGFIIQNMMNSASVAQAQAQASPSYTASEQALQEAIAQKLIVNTHEHVEGEGQLPTLFALMDRSGMKKTIMVGSSGFTLTMNEKIGFTKYDENNNELVRIAQLHPEKIEAWPTINPLDPEKVEKFKDLHKRGASGLKLYTGHGYTRRDTGDYMFHPIAMDDPSMFPLYQYLQDNHLPICFHVNPFEPGFAQELVEVLTLYPDMKVICPHFVMSSIKESRMREYLDTFPNLYSDISFGHDDFLTAGLARISKNPDKFRKIFADYPDRFMFGTDLVLTAIDASQKDAEWLNARVQAYYDMLTKETYTSSVFDKLPADKFDKLQLPSKTLNGLGLAPDLLRGILYENFEKFVQLKPEGTRITRQIDWSKMGVEELKRYPGQTFPPRKKEK